MSFSSSAAEVNRDPGSVPNSSVCCSSGVLDLSTSTLPPLFPHGENTDTQTPLIPPETRHLSLPQETHRRLTAACAFEGLQTRPEVDFEKFQSSDGSTTARSLRGMFWPQATVHRASVQGQCTAAAPRPWILPCMPGVP